MNIKGWARRYKDMSSTTKAALMFTVCGLLQKGIAFLIVPIYTRLMPAEDYGVYSVFFSWYQLIMIFTTLNMWNYLINNGMTEFGNKRKEFISSLQGLAGLITICWFVVYLIFSKTWERWTGLSLPMMLLMFAELLVMPSYEYWCSVKRYDYDAKGVIISALLIAFLTPAVSIVLILNMPDKGMAAITAKSGVATAIYLIVAIAMLRKEHRLYDREFWTYALKFNIPLIPHFLSMMLLQSCDRIMIERMCGPSDAAIYSVAYSASSALSLFNSAILSVFIPYTYRAIKEGREQDVGKRSLPLITLLGIINITLVMFAPEVIGVLAPAEYHAAVYVIPPVAMSNLLLFLFNLFANVEYYYKETKMVAIASVFSAIANIVLNYIFIKMFGYVAAGYTTVFCYSLFSVCHYIFMKKVCKKHIGGKRIYDVKTLTFVVVIFIVVSIASTSLYEEQFALVRYVLLAIILIVSFIKRGQIANLIKG